MNRPVLAAALCAFAAPALAENHAMSPFVESTLEYGESYQATTLLGMTVHATEREIDATVPLAAGAVGDWDEIGEIGDLIIGVDGTLQSVVVDVGGFLGVGEREVAIQWSALQGVREEDDPGEYFLGVTISQDMLEAAPEVVRVPAD
jgi:hypothetical protein